MNETKLITNVREMEDADELNKRRELIQAKTPSQLAEFEGLSDFPVPTRIEKMFRSGSRNGSITRSIRSESLPKSFSGKSYRPM